MQPLPEATFPFFTPLRVISLGTRTRRTRLVIDLEASRASVSKHIGTTMVTVAAHCRWVFEEGEAIRPTDMYSLDNGHHGLSVVSKA